MTEPASRRDSLQREIEWQEKNLKSLEAEKRFIPWLAALYLAVIPAGIWKGVLGIIVVLLGTTIILITAVYIQAQHRSEYLVKVEEAKRALADYERATRAVR